MNRYIFLISLTCVSLFLMSTTCVREEDVNISYYLYNESKFPIYIYAKTYEDCSDTLKTRVVFNDYKSIKKIDHGDYEPLYIKSIPILQVTHYNSQVMVFRESTFEKYAIREIVTENLYDTLYYIPWSEISKTGLEIIYRDE